MTEKNKQNKSPVPYDFSGLATAYGVPCSDGRIILAGAFAHQHDKVVPLVWKHGHDKMEDVIGNVTLVKTDTGIRANGRFNSSSSGKRAKLLVQNGDIGSLSIWANQLKQDGIRVLDGLIHEVSLVLSGANPGARIDDVIMHSFSQASEDDLYGVIIHFDGPIELINNEELDSESSKVPETLELVDIVHEGGTTLVDIYSNMSELQKTLTATILHMAMDENVLLNNEGADSGANFKEVFDSLTEEQKNLLNYMVGSVQNQLVQSELEEKTDIMKHNVFEPSKNTQSTGSQLTHAQMLGIINAAVTNKKSLKETFLAHATDYGIKDIELMFPEAQLLDGSPPAFYSANKAWVTSVIKGTRKPPFSRLKTMYADLTPSTIRAHGYVNADEKVNDVFQVYKRETTQQLIYKKTKIDRQDIIELTSFDVVAWMKQELRMSLTEELARAILIGDGRDVNDDDKIKEDKIRPIWKDDNLYAHKILMSKNVTELQMIDTVMTSRIYYQGSGSPTLFISPANLANLLIQRDTTGRRIHENEASLKAAMRVSEIVEVPLMTGLTRDGSTTELELYAILVDLSDYAVGTNRGGEMTLFDGFDIDFNQYKYLYELACSGALVIPKSALVFEIDTEVAI